MDSISEQAARWAIRVDSGHLQDDEQRELEAWLAADQRHLGAYVRAMGYWVDLDRLATLSGPAHANIALQEGWSSLDRRKFLVAGFAIAATGGGLSWYMLCGRPLVMVQRYTSDTGEQKRVNLEDGSLLLLNTRSEVRVKFTAQQRTVRLVTGEVLFQVAHDQSRPFIVETDHGVVRAVGTAFCVHIDSGQAAVTVTEGVVEVANAAVDLSSDKTPGAASENRTRVSALQRVVIKGKGVSPVQAITPADADRQFAWRDGMVFFDGESLQAAVADMNRYNERQIVIDDLKLAGRPIVGVFRVTDLEGFSAAAAAALKARVITDGGVIRLEPRSSSGE